MKVTHCISTLDKSLGGPSQSVTLLINSLMSNYEQNIYNLETFKSLDPIITNFDKTNGKITFFDNNIFNLNKNFKEKLIFSKSSIFHGHNLWRLPIHQMAVISRKMKTPYIISPRGTLEPWSLAHKYIKKKIGLLLYQFYDLQNANCLHATSDQEAYNFRRIGLTGPIAIIPNGIDANEFERKRIKNKKSKQVVLYLSRIHKIKGIELLLHAWSLVDIKIRNSWELLIIGIPSSQDYLNLIANMISYLHIEDQVKILAPKFGADKIKAFHNSEIFVLPSYSENFGLAVAEAAASGLPIITTKGTPWSLLESYNAGKWVDISIEHLKQALSELMLLSNTQRNIMGINAKKMILDNFQIDSISHKIQILYNWLLNLESKPDFVHLD